MFVNLKDKRFCFSRYSFHIELYFVFPVIIHFKLIETCDGLVMDIDPEEDEVGRETE